MSQGNDQLFPETGKGAYRYTWLFLLPKYQGTEQHKSDVSIGDDNATKKIGAGFIPVKPSKRGVERQNV